MAEQEAKMHKREEEFRRADNDRMRRFFNARYDDIPGSLSNKRGDEDGGPFPGGLGGSGAARSRSTTSAVQ